MLGFPYNYGDQLTEEKARDNFRSFVESYGSTICVNVFLFLMSKTAYASNYDKNSPTPKPNVKPGKNVEPHPAKAPVFTPILVPSKVINSKLWAFGGVGAITWICLTAASTGSPTLILACGALISYAIGNRK